MPTFILGLMGALGFWLGHANPLTQLPLLVLLYPATLNELGLLAGSWRTAFRNGWLTGIAGASAGLYWLAVPVHDYGNLPWVLAAPCAIAIGAYVGLYAGLFSTIAYALPANLGAVRRAMVLGVVWYGLEQLLGVFLSGFPWLPLASAFAPWPVVTQLAAAIGAYGLAGVLACFALLGMNMALGRQRLQSTLCMGIILAITATWGIHRLSLPEDQSTPVRASLVQGNINQDQKWEVAFQQSTVDRYLGLSAEAAATSTPDIVLWPETSMPFYYQEHKTYGPAIRAFAAAKNTAILLGAPGYANKASGNKKWTVFNRAFLVGPDGNDAGHYDKEHLVPFGEYIPPGFDLPFLQNFMQGVGDFTPGVDTNPLRLGNLALGVLICYETIFPEIAQQRVADGANLLVNISNDAWFGLTAAPEQHIQLAMLRAIEQSRYVLRGTNTGISAIIDTRGRITERGGLFRAEVISGTAYATTERTPYHRAAPYMGYGGALLVLLLLAVPRAATPSNRH